MYNNLSNNPEHCDNFQNCKSKIRNCSFVQILVFNNLLRIFMFEVLYVYKFCIALEHDK